MNILNVVGNIDEETGGGATERTRQVSIHLSRMGSDVTILTTTCSLSSVTSDSFKDLKAELKVVALPCLFTRFYVPWPLLRKVNKLVKQADVIHLFSHWTLINVMAYVAARINKKPYYFSPLGALPIYGRSKFLKKAYNFLVGKRMFQQASKILVPTLNESPALRDYAHESKIVHIPNGINEEDYIENDSGELRAKLGLKNHPFILFIGRLNPTKGPDLLLEAFCNIKDTYPDLHLVFIGPFSKQPPYEGGRLYPVLKKTSENNAVADRVHFLGYMSREDKSRIIHSSLFLAIPSRLEAMSIVVLESGIAGKPVLLTNQCGFNELEQIGGGVVVNADVDSIHEGISTMMSQKNNLYSMGKDLQASVRKEYLWSMVAKKHLSLFEQEKGYK
jgi:glycosyltransferase involved in cell wall biosynthesis